MQLEYQLPPLTQQQRRQLAKADKAMQPEPPDTERCMAKEPYIAAEPDSRYPYGPSDSSATRIR